jgi:cell division protein FtsQ
MSSGDGVMAWIRRFVPERSGVRPVPAHGRPKRRRSFKPTLGQGRGDMGRRARRLWSFLIAMELPRGVGVTATALIILSSVAWGVVRGGHLPVIVDEFKGARDLAANSVGLRIAAVALSGNKHLTREEVLAAAGVNGRTSLLFLDVGDARLRLKTNPWIAEATVQKLYPDRLRIAITEREAYALWQKDGRVGVIAADGTVLEPYVSRRFTGLPLFVGEGAAAHAKEFSALIERFPVIRDELRAAVLVAERRWNLRLKNGIDVRLPEVDMEGALTRLAGLVRDKQLLDRDIVAVDLRLPDRVTVRLSEAAAAAREEAQKAKKPKPKGGNA